MQGVQKTFDQGLITIDVPKLTLVETFSKVKKLNKNYLTLMLCRLTIMVRMLSDFHKMVLTIMKTAFRKLKPKIINFKKYKNFSNYIFRDTLS